ncbi:MULTISPECIES: outer membrane protein [Brucella]|jgi:opacity protein-like surface antigen|nr:MULTISPECIES: outer membrane protein [Brucella]MBK0023348.1 porin family protein [Ochrobactrum sp. S45]MBK0045282.1 porin family protein [Ochrobactrum sp. S46]MBO1026156.1 porin family protein [Ochrobactrum sp. SD129]MQP42347.1 outer membrane beta-barrel protein [Ochrobactrum sp. MYb237]KAB2686938.1 porin family protein [Brucella pseudogrignonensis]
MNSLIKTFCASLAVSAALTAMAPAAFAADYIEPVPEVVVAPPAVGGWYLRGDIGYSWNRFKRADYATIDDCATCGSGGPTFGSNTLHGDLKGSFLIGGGVGYQVTDYFRTDVTLDYMTRSKFNGNTFGANCGGDIDCASDERGHYSALSLLANAYVDLGNFGGVTPYVGAGIGGTRVKWADLNDVRYGNMQEGASDWRFTYALMAGASVDLTQSLKLDAGYRFRHINGGKMFEGNQWVGDGYDKGMNIHDVRVGLRYMFGG